MSALGRLLYARLVDVPVGELIHYDELSNVIGRDVQQDGRWYLKEARELARRQDRIVFDVERDIGIRRADNITTVSIAEGRVEGIARAAKRGTEILATVDRDELEPHDRARRDVAHLQLGALRIFAAAPMTKSLTKSAEGGRALPSPRTLMARALKMFEDST